MVEAPAQPLLRITSAALPVKAANMHLAVDALGDVARQRRLAGAGIAEQTEYLRFAPDGFSFSQSATALSAES